MVTLYHRIWRIRESERGIKKEELFLPDCEKYLFFHENFLEWFWVGGSYFYECGAPMKIHSKNLVKIGLFTINDT